MKPDKSPGPDGIPPHFYQLYWELIKEDITSAVLSFLNDGCFLPAWNNTHIVLIPKVDLPETISQFRPISLCNVIYRAASKCIALRLRNVIDGIVGQNQNAFVPGRLITDWGFLGHEVLTYINQRKRGTRCYGAIKLDMNKAFDRVSWPFLFTILKLFGFPKKFRKLIKTCVRTVSLQVLINGTPSGRIFPQCGLRQGDPISPYLFILCMEILSLMITKAESKGLIEGIKLSRHSPAISHLLYADDSLLCLRLTSSSCETLRSILNDFSSMSGQMINNQKSHIKFSPNSPADFKEHIIDILHVQPKTNFGSYLGIPIDLGRRKTSSFQFLLDKISHKILSWGPAHFSQAAKLILINSILMASVTYIASVLPIPQQITSKINFLIDLFWWKTSQKKRAQHWLPFEQLQLSKTNGGTVKSTFLLRDGIAWKFGNGSLIDLRNDAWVLGNKPILKSQSQVQTISFADIMLDSTHWNSTNVFRFFNKATATSICALELPPEPTDDYIYWKFTEDGFYSAKSGYLFLLDRSHHSSISNSHFALIWKLPCQPHIKIFLWKIARNILPTADILIRRGLIVDHACCFFNLESETLAHLFRDCCITKRLWFASHLGIRVDSSSNIPFTAWMNNFLSYFSLSGNHEPYQVLHFSLLLFAIWKHRNNVIFRDCRVNPAAILQEADMLLSQQLDFMFRSKSDKYEINSTDVACLRIPSPELIHHYFKIEVTFNKKTWQGSFRIRCNANIIHEVPSFFCNSHLQCSITALLEAMSQASACKLQDVLFTFGNTRLLQLLHKKDSLKVSVAFSNSILRIKSYLSCNFKWYISGYV
ncbi:uncharacterized protein LOC141607574 [Silene latifolia]|uniref:uncharacterized protein LOC141607574 n=1 Tax=Silene latifolia TaxID=37657 RepID=UPI003D76BDCD